MKRYGVMIKRACALVLFVMAAATVAGCVPAAPAPRAPDTEAAGTDPTEMPDESTAEMTAEETAEMTAGSSDVPASVGTLTFAVQQSTFLSAIADVMDELGEPDEHVFVEFDGPDGISWQGERLTYADRDVLLLQPVATDGMSAVRIDSADGADLATTATLLPSSDAPTGDAPNVDVQFVRARLADAEEGTWSFDVRVAHPDTGWEDYVDGWHVETVDGRILGTRILVHPHVNEQPFSRSLSGVVVPDGVEEVRIRPHDLVSGYGAATDAISLDEAASGDWFEVVR